MEQQVYIICPLLLILVSTHAAAFWLVCSLSKAFLGGLQKTALQYCSQAC